MTHDHTPGDGTCKSCDQQLAYLQRVAEQAIDAQLTVTFKLSSIPEAGIGGVAVHVVPAPGLADQITPDLLAELLEIAAAEARATGMVDITTGADR